MSIFDFLKPRRDFMSEMQSDPLTRDVVRAAEIESAEKQVNNLRLVGRAGEATKLVSDLLRNLLNFWKGEPSNPVHICLIAETALRLGEAEAGRKILETIIETTENSQDLDLTTLYLNLGILYRQLDLPPERELDCYRKAGDAAPPPNGKYTATRKQKAKAHYLAYLAASRLLQESEARWHLSKAEEFAPGVKFNDTAAVAKFFEDRRSVLTPDAARQAARLAAEAHQRRSKRG